jgi:hypothetical protein
MKRIGSATMAEDQDVGLGGIVERWPLVGRPAVLTGRIDDVVGTNVVVVTLGDLGWGPWSGAGEGRVAAAHVGAPSHEARNAEGGEADNKQR